MTEQDKRPPCYNCGKPSVARVHDVGMTHVMDIDVCEQHILGAQVIQRYDELKKHSVFFTSDHHFGHKRIPELANRPFKTLDEMHETLISRWNETVSRGDKVYHMGDFALGPIEESLQVVKELNGEITLVVGNHDRNFRLGKRSGGLEPTEWDQRYRNAGFADIIADSVALVGWDDNEPVMLSHFPYNGDHFDADRFEEVRPKDSGLPVVHGHTHSRNIVSYSEKGTLQIHIGVDSWDYRPVSYEQVTEIIRALRIRA